MGISGWRRGGIALTAAAAVVVGVAGCQSGDSGTKKDAAAPKASKAAAPQASPVEALTAAFKKVSVMKSAKFSMAMSGAGVGDAAEKMTGTVGWDPIVMEMTIDTPATAGADSGAPSKTSGKMIGSAVYVEIPADLSGDPEFKQAMGDKRWMKVDVAAAAKEAGTVDPTAGLGSSLQSSNNDPSSQLGMLVNSPDIKLIGSETTDGVPAKHYQGTFGIDDLLKSTSTAKGLTADQRQKYGEAMKKSGITSEHVDAWIGTNNYPVRMDMSMDTAKGPIKISLHYSDYSAKAPGIKAPPAGQTTTIEDMMKVAQAHGATS